MFFKMLTDFKKMNFGKTPCMSRYGYAKHKTVQCALLTFVFYTQTSVLYAGTNKLFYTFNCFVQVIFNIHKQYRQITFLSDSL